MQNPTLFLHKQVENILIFSLHIRKNRTIYASQLAIRGINLSECPGDRWPSDFCRMAIRVTPQWPSVLCPIAIHLMPDGHRTGGGTLLFHVLIRQAFVRGALSACSFSSFQESHFPFSFITQRLTSHECVKIRVFPSIVSLARKYAILACGIYSLTKCQ